MVQICLHNHIDKTHVYLNIAGGHALGVHRQDLFLNIGTLMLV